MARIKFNNVYLKDYFTVVGPKEKNSKLDNFDLALEDYYFGTNTFEKAEIKMQTVVIENLMARNMMAERDFDYLLAGDLVNQISISSYNAREFKIPYLGLYAACATFPLELLMAGNLLESKCAKNILCVTSSHTNTAERQYRYPVEYGNNKPHTATCTATGAVGVIVTSIPTKIKIKSGTIGKVIDLGVNDANHMGAVMAPACADTLHEHLESFGEKLKDYDVILTGDLGTVGLDILKEYYEKVFHEKLTNVMDAGSNIYLNSQEMFAGGSGPCCLPLVFICKLLRSKRYKKILLLGTGSLHSPVMLNQKETIPAVCHAVSIEVIG